MRPALLLPLLLALPAVALAAPARPAPEKRAAALDALSACRREADGAARLACYDRAAGALDEAEARGQVVVLDREQVRTVRRQAFGLSLPAFNLFGGRGAAAAEDRVDRVTYTLERGGRTVEGKAMFYTQEGPIWIQTDSEGIDRPAHAGSKLAVRQAAMGSFFCNLDGQRAVRCQRQR